jgi:glycoprotein endo-alpha-1,2-mannosidase
MTGLRPARQEFAVRIVSLLVPLLAAACTAVDAADVLPGARVHAFYYGWYATAAVDGRQAHWNHEVLGVDDGGRFPGGDDIGADFYPRGGPYSSGDPAAVARHVREMEAAGIGVIVASWWGAGSAEDRNLPLLLDAAAAAGLEVAFHLEPFPGRTAATSGEALGDLVGRYGDHPACHRPAAWGGRPVVYVYDSYLTPAADWADLLQPDGEITIRGTARDCVMIGLWVEADEGEFFTTGGFDGYYTYFAADGFTWSSSRANWPRLAAFAADHDLLFVPCVGPGYCDTRIRPWNAATTRDREDGAYYDRQFAAAVAVNPPVIAITSYNEWHEGTQIEPAVPLAIAGFTYRDYEPRDPGYYLERTRHWVTRWREARE